MRVGMHEMHALRVRDFVHDNDGGRRDQRDILRDSRRSMKYSHPKSCLISQKVPSHRNGADAIDGRNNQEAAV